MSRAWKRAFLAGCIVIALGAAFAGAVQAADPFFWYSCSLTGVQAEGQGQQSVLYARDGTRLGTLGTSLNRIPVHHRPAADGAAAHDHGAAAHDDDRRLSGRGV